MGKDQYYIQTLRTLYLHGILLPCVLFIAKRRGITSYTSWIPVYSYLSSLTVFDTPREFRRNCWQTDHIKLLGATIPPSNLGLIPGQDLSAEISNLELRTVILVLAQQSNPYSQKKYWSIKKPNIFSRGVSGDLQAFIFQCKIYFWIYCHIVKWLGI